MYHESIEEDEKEYHALYGHLPDTREDLIQYLYEKYKYDDKKVEEAIKNVASIPWEEIKLTFFINPWGTPRPRLKKWGGVYVKGAKKHKKIMEKTITNAKIIYTRVQFQICTYQPTPKSTNKIEKLLFEKGICRPLADPDWDNLGKTYSDMIQGILITNDNIITDSLVTKFYSIKPRVEIIIQFQTQFDCHYNKQKVLKSNLFQKYVNEEEQYHDKKSINRYDNKCYSEGIWKE